MIDKLKQFIKSSESELVLALGVILVSLFSFAAGHLTAPKAEKQQITIEQFQASAFKNITDENLTQDSRNSSAASGVHKPKTLGKFVASKNSSKYHLPTCVGAKRIAEHNKIWFSSKEEAESLGYTPASNCPGL